MNVLAIPHRRTCPFCEWITNSAEADEEMRQHVLGFHKDRIAAAAAYQRVMSHGGDEVAARAAYNAAILHRGPGQYDRRIAS